MCFQVKRYIAGFALASCFGILCACTARADMMLHIKHTLEGCLHVIGLM